MCSTKILIVACFHHICVASFDRFPERVCTREVPAASENQAQLSPGKTSHGDSQKAKVLLGACPLYIEAREGVLIHSYQVDHIGD